MFSVGSFFSGIGGFCYGFESQGFATKWATDFDKNVASTYRLNFPTTNFIEEDLKNLEFSEFECVDVVHGGFPCQSFSSAGNRKGFDDPLGRGKLFDVMMDRISELREPPKVLVFENSPFILVGNQGGWFEYIKQRINRAGYWFSEANAVIGDTHIHGGLPQRRERVFMIATLKTMFDYNPFHSLPDADRQISLKEIIDREQDVSNLYLPRESKYHSELKAPICQGKVTGKYQLIQYRRIKPRVIPEGFCPTLTANMGGGGHNVPFWYDQNKDQFRKLSVRECLDLQGFPTNFLFPQFAGMGPMYKMVGNSVSPKVSSEIAKQISSFLTEAQDGVKLAV